MSYSKLILHISVCAALIGNIYGSEPQTERFIKPVAIKFAPPVYPKSEIYSGNSGLVEVTYIIDKTGKAIKPLIVRSTSMKFEESAINAVKKYSYEPASYDGRPVSSKASMVINFHLDDDVGGVSREFASRYKKASKELDKANPDLAKIDGVIQRLGSFKHATNYALARYSLIKLRRAMLTVDIEQQIEATRNLLLFDQKLSEDSRMLDLETFKTVRHSLFFLLVQTQRYVDALDLYDDIKKSDDSAALSLAETVKKIKSLRDSRNPSAISIKLGKRGYQLEKLFTNSLMLRDVEGELRSLSFRCDRHYAELDLLAETEYRIPSSWGDCLLEIAGKPETSATLVQF